MATQCPQKHRISLGPRLGLTLEQGWEWEGVPLQQGWGWEVCAVGVDKGSLGQVWVSLTQDWGWQGFTLGRLPMEQGWG